MSHGLSGDVENSDVEQNVVSSTTSLQFKSGSRSFQPLEIEHPRSSKVRSSADLPLERIVGDDFTFGPRRRTHAEVSEMAEMALSHLQPALHLKSPEALEVVKEDAVFSFMEWVAPRVGDVHTKSLVLGYAVSATLLNVLKDKGTKREDVANPASVLTVALAVSLSLGLFLAIQKYGVRGAAPLLFNWHAAWRFMLVAILFTLARVLNLGAIFLGAKWSLTTTVGYVYMPMAALFSVMLMRGHRVYGRLEWLSLGIITLSTMTVVNLRMRALGMHKHTEVRLVAIVALSASVSALGSVLAERIYKGRSNVVNNSNFQMVQGDDFVIYKVHMDLAALTIALMLWLLPNHAIIEAVSILGYDERWFGNWDVVDVLKVIMTVAQGWIAGMFVRRFSTVLRSIEDTLVTVFVIVVLNPILAGDSRFEAGSIPSTMLTFILVLAALIFQTGRLNISVFRKRLSFQANFVEGPWVPEEPMTLLRKYYRTYGSMVIFVLLDAARTLSQQQALSRSMITPMSMVLASYLAGIGVAVATIVTSGSREEKLQNVKCAIAPSRILRYLPCAMFFALASTAQCMAYANGISAAVATALGYIYMPLSALVSRWVLNKYYIWLEWFSLFMLTFASAVFGYLQNHFSSVGSASQGSSVLGVVLVIASAFASVLGSLIAEKVLKAEELPFHVQKVALDFGSVLSTCVLFPIIGFLSSRPQDAFWKLRPLHGTCDDALCWARGPTEGCADPACSCACGAGVFVAWDSWLVIFALFVSVAQGWLTGKIIKEFSTVLRAIAQSSTILVIYFIGDPLLCSRCAMNWPLTLVAFMVPLSTATFMVAVTEMEKVVVRKQEDSQM